MVSIRAFVLAVALLFAPSVSAQTTPPHTYPWIVLADSITTLPIGGMPTTLPWASITQERDVSFAVIGAPASVMGSTLMNGFNHASLTQDLDRNCGMFWYCSGVIIQAGTNDWIAGVSWAQQQQAYLRVLDWAASRQKKVFMVDLIYNRDAEAGGANAGGVTFAQMRTNRQQLCATRALYCTFASRPPDLSFDNPLYYSQDGIHLIPTGRTAYRNWLVGVASRAGLF